MEALFPSTTVVILASLLSITRFENQRWLRALQRGMRGSSETVGLLVTLTGFAGTVFGLAFLVSYAIQYGWMSGLGLIFITFAVPLLYVFISRDNWIVWLIGTVAMWPLMIALAFQTNWFGLMQSGIE